MDNPFDFEGVVHVFIYKCLITRALQNCVWTALVTLLVKVDKRQGV